MRIEINSGGLGSLVAVASYQADMKSFVGKAEDVISSFKTVRKQTNNLNGGVGNLRSALDDINARIQKEEEKVKAAEAVHQKTNDFLALAKRVDKQVAAAVDKNRDQFYKKYPHLEPPKQNADQKSWCEKAWAWLCGKGEAIQTSLSNAAGWIKDTAKKAWDGLSEFYCNNKKRINQILIGVAAITVAVIVTVATGGAALPALIAMTKAAITAGLMSAAIGGSITALVSLATGSSLEDSLHAALNSAIDGFCSGFMWGGIFAAGSQTINSLKTLAPKKPMTQTERFEMSKERGRVFEEKNFTKMKKKYDNAQTQITIETPSGTRTKVDGIAQTKNGKIIIEESKSSLTAPLTKNQKVAFPEIFESGGVVKGAGKGLFKGGFQIPPGTKVTVIRPTGVGDWEAIVGGIAGLFGH